LPRPQPRRTIRTGTPSLLDASTPNRLEARRMAANPLVRQLGLTQLLEREAQALPDIQQIGNDQVESALAGHIRHSWTQNKLAKYKIERRMLNCLRARRGEYSQDALAQIQANGGTNIVWADLTETKCRGASAWIREIVLPAGERPWGIQPTPIPDLPRGLKETIVAKSIDQAKQAMLQMQQEAGQVMEKSQFRDTVAKLGTQLREQAERELKKASEKRAKAMEERIADNLAQGSWEEAADGFVEDFVTFPAAVIKGPVSADNPEDLDLALAFDSRVSFDNASKIKNGSLVVFSAALSGSATSDGQTILQTAAGGAGQSRMSYARGGGPGSSAATASPHAAGVAG
jgi:hypothetical protein